MAVAEPVQVQYEARPHQARALTSKKRHIFMGCGVGAGKTDTASVWAPMKCAEAPTWPKHKAQGIICANTYPQLYDSTLRNLFSNWDRLGFPFRPSELPRGYYPITVELLIHGQWRQILCRSLDSPKTLSGLEVGWVVCDEVWATDRQAISIINARVRAKEQPVNQTLYATTLDDATSWMYDFVHETSPERIEVIYATTYDNEPNLPGDYIEDLKDLYSISEFDRMVMAKWVSLKEGRVYPQFERARHVASEDFEYDPLLGPVYWAHDFNVAEGVPLSSLLFQVSPNVDEEGRKAGSPIVRVFDEIVLDGSDVHDACDELEARPYHQDVEEWVICGDASGRRLVSSKVTDYGILRQRGYTHHRVPSRNPPIRSRIESVRRILRSAGDSSRCLISPRCATLIKGLETVSYKPNAIGAEKQTREQHITTALGYAVHELFPPPGACPSATVSEIDWL